MSKKAKDEKKHIYVTYNERCVNVIKDTRGEDGPWSGYREDEYDFCVKQAFKDSPQNITPYWEEVEFFGEEKVPCTVYVLYVKYSTGDTFSHSSGRGQIVAAYASSEDAIRDKQYIEEDAGYALEDRWNPPKKPREKKWTGYANWNGYFEHFEGAYIEALNVI
jgi:hypothetical protein